MIGKTLAHYSITAEIGKGGMGVVYRAKDTKLGREVAIKVLPEEFAKDSDRVARFQREAKLLASLNHPNIAAIHGLEEADGTHFLVLELVEGQTLAERITGGPIDVEEALKLGLQIAEALEAAHEKGVIHRDLKPANIKVTPDGKVKVLDFGLAKAYAGEQDQVNLSNSPTLSDMATQQGLILGTAAYMSPEQARGKPVDKRTDVWAFGCVLYEMLTGQSAFQGEDVTEILAAVVKSEVDLNLLPANIHPKVCELLLRCLQKNQKRRYAGSSDVQYDIELVLADPKGVSVQLGMGAEPIEKSRQFLLWAAATIILIIIAGVTIWYLKPSAPDESRLVLRSDYEVPLGPEFLRIGETLEAISDDGTMIVYVANQQLYLRYLKDLHAIPIQGTDEDPASPFFSPDGQWIGYYSFVNAQWKKIPVTGGASVNLCIAPDPNGAVWTENKTILFGQRDGSSIMRVSENGGEAEAVIKAKEGEAVYQPHVLPGEEWVLFTLINANNTGQNRWDEARIAVESLKTGERKILPTIIGSDARYVSTGHIVYAQGNGLRAVAFDIENMEVIGGATPIIEGLRRGPAPITGTAHYGISDTGTLVYVAYGETAIMSRFIVWVDREGNPEPLGTEPKLYSAFKISPDGKKVALAVVDEGTQHIQVWDIDRKISQPITFGDSMNSNPLWTPDSEYIVFSSVRDNKSAVYRKAANGTGNAELIGEMQNIGLVPCSWSDDGKTLILQSEVPNKTAIVMLSLEKKQECVPLLDEDYPVGGPMISPKGRWIAYTAFESGDFRVYVSPFPNLEGGRWLISPNGGRWPLWSPNGGELFYRTLTNEVISVEYEETESAFIPGFSKTLFSGSFIAEAHNHWDISPDGKRFLMFSNRSPLEDSEYQIIIVQNWFEELKQKVPVP